jgi:hypothetical protein
MLTVSAGMAGVGEAMILKALLAATVLLLVGASGGCSAPENTAPDEKFCAAMGRLHRASQAMAAELGDDATPYERGRATGRFIVRNRADIDTAMRQAPPPIREDTRRIHGQLLSGEPVAPEDVSAVQASDRRIQRYVERECPG